MVVFSATDFTDSHGFIFKKSVEIRAIRGKKTFAKGLIDKFFTSYNPRTELLLPVWVLIARNISYPFGLHQIIDIFIMRSRIPPNMFRDKASILMEAKSKRKPISATSVVGTGLVSVHQKKDNVSL